MGQSPGGPQHLPSSFSRCFCRALRARCPSQPQMQLSGGHEAPKPLQHLAQQCWGRRKQHCGDVVPRPWGRAMPHRAGPGRARPRWQRRAVPEVLLSPHSCLHNRRSSSGPAQGTPRRQSGTRGWPHRGIPTAPHDREHHAAGAPLTPGDGQRGGKRPPAQYQPCASPVPRVRPRPWTPPLSRSTHAPSTPQQSHSRGRADPTDPSNTAQCPAATVAPTWSCPVSHPPRYLPPAGQHSTAAAAPCPPRPRRPSRCCPGAADAALPFRSPPPPPLSAPGGNSGAPYRPRAVMQHREGESPPHPHLRASVSPRSVRAPRAQRDTGRTRGGHMGRFWGPGDMGTGGHGDMGTWG